MRFVPVRELRVAPASVWATLDADERLVLTNRGRPAALMLKVDGDSLFETVAALDRARLAATIARIREQTAAARADQMTPEEIEAEIVAARAEGG
jgi:hypothetical protein